MASLPNSPMGEPWNGSESNGGSSAHTMPEARTPLASPGQTGGPAVNIRRKLVVVGDGACGKTSLLLAYKNDSFTSDYAPTVFENSQATVPVENRTVELSLWDTAGQEDYDRLRPLSYPDSNVILVCFAIDKVDSILNVQRKWAHELEKYCPDVPRILVGCKSDLRADCSLSELVSADQGKNISQSIGAVSYIECSAKTRENVAAVFSQAARASLTYQRRKKSNGSRAAPAVSGPRRRCKIQ